MSIKWTDEQQKAITEKGKNVLVSAAAGSGKTAVLVERVIQLITDKQNPITIDRLLIVTFTNAAANGMQIKIHKKLQNLLEKSKENKHIANQLVLLPKATITTVHSFCQDLIRNNFLKLGLNASFEIGDDTQLSILREKALAQTLEMRYENSSKAFEGLVDGFGGKKDDKSLSDIIMNLYYFTQSVANPKQWLETAKDNFCDQGFDLWSKYILLSLKEEIKGMIKSYDSAIDAIISDIDLHAYHDTFVAERGLLENILFKCSGGWDEMREFICSIKFVTLPRKGKNADDAKANFAKKIRDNVKKSIKNACDTFYSSAQSIKADNIELSEIIGELCSIVWDFTQLYSELKRDRNLVDFNDLEHFSLKLLEDNEISKQVKDKFAFVLVDEYQDTNGVQEGLFQAVSTGDNLFMVGDVKQSIYGFRNAQPSIFTQKAERYRKDPKRGTLINLFHNFRSDDNIISFANNVFYKIMSEHIGNVNYTDGHGLKGVGKSSTQSEVEINLIEKKFEFSDEYSVEEQLSNDMEREAMFVARRIRKLVEVEKPLIPDESTGKTRRLQYRDIAILARKNKGISDVFSQQLDAFNIPFYCEDEKGDYTESFEVSIILSFLSVIDNPIQDIPLIAVMRSPLFSFDDEQLVRIRNMVSERPFYNAVCADNSFESKAFLQALDKYRKVSKDEKIEYLIRKILSDTGFLSYVATLSDGETRIANLRLLCERAGRFESDTHKTLFEFLSYLSAMKEHSYSYSVSKTSAQNDNAVKIMSIHKSKGLEFPAVFFVRCGEMFNKTDLRSPLQYDIDFGIGCDFIDIRRGIKYPNLSKTAISQKKLYSLLSEEMRIMYVALTRAQHLLFVSASCNNIEKKLCDWENSSPLPYTVALQNTFIDWIGIALGEQMRMLGKVHVPHEILAQNEEKPAIETYAADKASDTAYSKEIAERLEYEYPYKDAKYIPSKLPVSRAIGEVMYEVNLKTPEFLQKPAKMTAALRGTIIHFVLQNIDLSQTDSKQQIQNQLYEMVAKGMLSKDFANVVDIEKLFIFFKSDIGFRMKSSPEVKREVKFFVDIPADKIINDLDKSVANETILLQGVVDCYFVEDGQLVIVDYKTGRPDRAEFQKQLDLYAMGLSKALNMKVKETILYPLV
ncbi:MAG: helicase-exonuclease AddAB subunit AddA [Firmicutes bacterium]|nr:helicase-exonuclease AddAB subunit AddA [Bacillota bacterium]